MKRKFSVCAAASLLFIVSCTKINLKEPSGTLVTIDDINSITSTVAVIKGTNNISDKAVGGICWSTTNATPDLNAHIVRATSEGGKFSANLLGLQPLTTYYVRAFFTSKNDGSLFSAAANANGKIITYGNARSFKTLDMPTVKICNHIWMQKNLDVETYQNGDTIPQVTDLATWRNLTTGAWCYLANDSINYGPVYGRLYNYYAVVDPRGLAPAGWHVSTYYDWNEMKMMLGGQYVAGPKLKETGTAHWVLNDGATNSSGFTALPGEARLSNVVSESSPGKVGAWWTSDGWSYHLLWISNSLDGFPSAYGEGKNDGFSVRCVKN